MVPLQSSTSRKKEVTDDVNVEQQRHFIREGRNFVRERYGDWHMYVCLEMNVIMGKTIDLGCVFEDEVHVERYYLGQLKNRIRTLAEQKACRGLCFVEGKAIMPADLWMESKLLCSTDADFDQPCGSEEIALIF